MVIINKIEISKFRSIYKSNIDVEDINIFSGKNNQGKSNVLKALNLFFNNHSSFGQEFDHEKDFNIAYTGQAGGRREVVITLYFSGQGSGALKDNFYITKKIDQTSFVFEYHSSDHSIDSKIEKDGNIKRQFTAFLHQLEYFYVPAVRDKKFVQSLLLQFERLLEDTKGKQFKKKISELSEILKEKSNDISSDFEKFINLPTNASLSTSVKDVLGAVRIFVKSGLKISKKKGAVVDAEIDLFSSGDGVLMSYIPHFLSNIFSTVKRKKFILGFEEPENSLEYSKIQSLSEKFHSEFKNYAQIFITTHSPAFIKLRDNEDVNFFRVYINPDDPKQISEIQTLDVISKRQQSLFKKGEIDSSEYKTLSAELAMVEQSLEIGKIVDQQIIETKKLVESRDRFNKNNKKLLNKFPKNIFVCEDSDPKTINLWKKMIDDGSIKVMSSEGCSTENVEIWIKQNQVIDPAYKPKVFRQVDRDGLDDKRVDRLKKFFESKFSKYKYCYSPLSVNEVENFAVINAAGFNKKFWNKYSNDVENHFERTAQSLIVLLDKKFNYNDPLFKNAGAVNILQELRAAARLNWKFFFPGKMICSKITNFCGIQYLDGLDKKDYPQELNDYLKKIKDFFN